MAVQSTGAPSRDEVAAFLEEKRRKRGTAPSRDTGEMIEAIIVIYNRELDQLVRLSEAGDLTEEQHETLRVVTTSTIALHRALTVVTPGTETKDLSKASMSELRQAARP